MKMAMFVNDVQTEQPIYTTTRLALAAVNRGHDVWYIGADDLACDPDDAIRARAWPASRGATSLEEFLSKTLVADRQRITVDDLDLLLLRNDPADDLPDRRWAQTVGVHFGDLASRRGVTVLNDPCGLSRALTKLYLNYFPRDVHPASLVTRDAAEIRDFVHDHGGTAVLKPLQGSGGHGVFIVHPDDEVNLDQMVEALARDGYLVAQEYVPGAERGDTRLFLVDGRPLQVNGTYAAFRRIPAAGEARANVRAGAMVEPANVDDDTLRLVDIVGPRLREDGMFLVGLDIIGNQLIEINMFSPGGLGTAQSTTGTDFAAAMIEALEFKVG